MSENTNSLETSRQNLLVFIWKKRLTISIITGVATIAAIVISLLMTPMFKSTAIVFPAATSTVSFSEQRNAKASSMDFGEEEHADQLVQILQSSRIRNRIVQQFKLFQHYEIDQNDPNKNFKLNKAYNDHIQFVRTRYGSIEISVLDKDRELAAKIANKIVDLIDTVKNDMVKERTIPAFQINQRKRDMLQREINEIFSRLDSLSALGVVSSEVRANLHEAINNAKSAEHRAEFQRQKEVNEKYGAAYDGLEELRDEKILKLTKFEDSYEQSESDANAAFNHKFVVESAVVADKKDKPKRMIIVLLAFIGAFVFSVFALLVKDRIAELRRVA